MSEQITALPLRVIPIDDETAGDSKATRIVIVIVCALSVIGVVSVIVGLQLDGASSAALLISLAIAISFAALIGSNGDSEPRALQEIELSPPTSTPPISDAPQRVGRTPTLDYRSRQRKQLEPIRAGVFSGGFFSALGVCGACFFLLAATVDFQPKSAHVIFLLIVVTVVIATGVIGGFISRRPGFRGFGAGLATGMGLGMLALGPCGFCYLMTLN